MNPGAAQAGVQFAAVSTFRSAPLPTVEEFGGYEAVLPGAAERIMRQAEKTAELAERQQGHRFAIENRVVDGNLKAQIEGMRHGSLLCALVITGGIFLLFNDKPIEGLIGILTPLVLLAGVFVYGKSQQPQQLADKKAAEMVREGAQPGVAVARRNR